MALFVAFVVLSLVRSGGDVVGSLVSAAIYSVVFLAIWRVLIWKQPTVVIDERGQRSSERNGRLTAYYRERRARQVNINGLPRSPHGPSR
ncbi:hypothetical protein WHI96_27145 [Pseudonocardia tropica]|uniref:Uncharacterized protein n=1 Tax=Pseudonocardia tropica TaxID=681289 RepID=A0ABV1K555_9PSEU